MGVEKVFSTKSRKRLHQILLPYRKEVVYVWYARVRKRTRPIKRGSRTTKQRSRTEGSERDGQRNKEAVQRGAREPDNETKKPYRGGAREPDNETKKPNRGEQESRTTKQREPDNGTKRAGQRNKESRTTKQRNQTERSERAGQGSEAVEHPLTFGSYINNQIGK